MENFITEFKQTAGKNHKKSLQNINKRTAENTDLIKELQDMRAALHHRKQQLNTLDQKIQGEAQKET